MNFGGRGRGGSHQNQNQNQFHSSQSFGAGPAQNTVQVEIYGWNGSSPAECIAFIARKCKVNVTNYSVDTNLGALRGFVRSDRDADSLASWSGVRFAGNPLKMSKLAAPGSTGGSKAGGDDTIQSLKTFLYTRYNAEMKLLNLSAVQEDPVLASKGFFASMSTSSKFFPALMKVASDLKLDITSADLSGNNLTDLSSISTLAHSFPALKNLSLQNNKIGRVRAFDVWKKHCNCLRELIIVGNPLLNTADPNGLLDIKLELMKVFPRLVVLNGEIVRNEQALQQMLKFPFGQPQSMFFSDPDVQGISTNFISNFINMWDDDRAGLMVLYQNESQFSLQVDSSSPHTSNPKGPPDFGYYLPSSRNLTRVSSAKIRKDKVATGAEQIFKIFSQIPKTRHDLMTKPQNYSMEAYKIAQLGAISITLHGNFEEVAVPVDTSHVNQSSGGRGKYSHKKTKINLGWKSFDRSIVVIPGANNSMIVASDLLCVRPEADSEVFRPSQDITMPNGAVSAVPTPSPSPAPSVGPIPAMGAPVTAGVPTPGPTAADLPAELKTSLSPQQQELLVKVLIETKLSIQYGFMLCQQSNWDYSQCSMNFKSSASSLPPDAFGQ
ncbi:hypothetical protein OXX80_003988 [Metschnikowia pulcherrima]